MTQQHSFLWNSKDIELINPVEIQDTEEGWKKNKHGIGGV